MASIPPSKDHAAMPSPLPAKTDAAGASPSPSKSHPPPAPPSFHTYPATAPPSFHTYPTNPLAPPSASALTIYTNDFPYLPWGQESAARAFEPGTPPRWTLRTHLWAGVLAALLLSLVVAFYASFPLIVLLTPKPETQRWSPSGVRCASCEEVGRHNAVLAGRVGCRMMDYVPVSSVEDGKRCWGECEADVLTVSCEAAWGCSE
tara:strand:- start:12578 stop:13189 length:612 start_codon:yes stop_codon:yes gene_type:complete